MVHGLSPFKTIRRGFAEGELTVVANTIDIAGNPTTATDTIVKDTLAKCAQVFDDGGDSVLNISKFNPLNFSVSFKMLRMAKQSTSVFQTAPQRYRADGSSSQWRLVCGRCGFNEFC
ncbi:hypothetical protein OH492_10565 [Vibrio chagasii]|nr:hypothetical protein [Vibrio chagasii]